MFRCSPCGWGGDFISHFRAPHRGSLRIVDVITFLPATAGINDFTVFFRKVYHSVHFHGSGVCIYAPEEGSVCRHGHTEEKTHITRGKTTQKNERSSSNLQITLVACTCMHPVSARGWTKNARRDSPPNKYPLGLLRARGPHKYSGRYLRHIQF